MNDENNEKRGDKRFKPQLELQEIVMILYRWADPFEVWIQEI